MDKLIQLHGYDVDLSTDAKIVFVGKALKLNGQHTFDMNEDQFFVAHVGGRCDSHFIKRIAQMSARHTKNALIKGTTISGTERAERKIKRCRYYQIWSDWM